MAFGQISQRGAQVRGADGCHRNDLIGPGWIGGEQAHVEPAHAVADDVKGRGAAGGTNALGEHPDPAMHASRGMHAWRYDLNTKLGEMLANAAKVVAGCKRADAIALGAKKAMTENNGKGWDAAHGVRFAALGAGFWFRVHFSRVVFLNIKRESSLSENCVLFSEDFGIHPRYF